jgi:hypothetical protein
MATTEEKAVYLSDLQLENFVKFQKNLALFVLLERHEALDIKNGSVQIHFTAEGKVGKIEVHKSYVY